MYCLTEQPVGQTCANKQCGKTLSKYYCGVCNLWDNDPTKKIYHCHDCGLCRIGEGLGMGLYTRECAFPFLPLRQLVLPFSPSLSPDLREQAVREDPLQVLPRRVQPVGQRPHQEDLPLPRLRPLSYWGGLGYARASTRVLLFPPPLSHVCFVWLCPPLSFSLEPWRFALYPLDDLTAKV